MKLFILSLSDQKVIVKTLVNLILKLSLNFSFYFPEANVLNCFMTDRRINQETANFRYNVYLIYDQKLTDKPQFYLVAMLIFIQIF